MEYRWYIFLDILVTVFLLVVTIEPQLNNEADLWFIVVNALFTVFVSVVYLCHFLIYLKELEVVQMFEEQRYTGRAQGRARARPQVRARARFFPAERLGIWT